MGHVFQDERWQKNPTRCSFGFLWLHKIGKIIRKGFEREKRNLYMKIKETRSIGR